MSRSKPDRRSKHAGDKLASTIRTPMGNVPRCQAQSRAGVQCRRPARKGYTVCSTHGAGTRRREREGTRKNPRTASVTNGLHAQPDTLAELQQLDPDYKALLEYYRGQKPEALRNLDELLASLWAMRDVLARKLPAATETEFGESPPALLSLLNALASALERVARIEGRIRASSLTINLTDAHIWVGAVLDILHEFVPEDRLDAALRKLESLGDAGADRAPAAAEA